MSHDFLGNIQKVLTLFSSCSFSDVTKQKKNNNLSWQTKIILNIKSHGSKQFLTSFKFSSNATHLHIQPQASYIFIEGLSVSPGGSQ